MAVDGPHDDYAADYVVRGTEAGDSRGSSAQREVAAEERDRFACYDELRARDVGEQRDHPDGAERTADGGWRWKGFELEPEANRIADAAIAARRQAEGRDPEGNYAETGITPVMRRIEAELEHGSLVPDTEKFALKSPDRFKEKLAKQIALEPDTPAENLAARIHDGIRYTFTFRAQWYSDGTRQAEGLLADQGCELVARKPNWKGDEYRGINTQWRDTSSGQLFEVQFHTSESWDAKQRTHDAYEKIECPTTTPAERVRLREFQREIVTMVPIPPGALEFVEYRVQRGQRCQSE